jgi:exopolysaccharide biosynthesis polyprenyl glycosylphosphotransferase
MLVSSVRAEGSQESGQVEVGKLLPFALAAGGPTQRKRTDTPASAKPRRRESRLRWPEAYRLRLVLGDLVAGLLASTTALLVRFGYVPSSEVVVAGVVLTALAWVTAVRLLKGYQTRNLGQGAEEYRTVVWAGSVLLGAVALTSYAFKMELSRGYAFLVVPLVVIFSLVLRKVLRTWLSRQRILGNYRQRTIVVGSLLSATELIRELRRSPSKSFELTGACITGAGTGDRSEIDGVPVVGNPRDVVLAVDFNDADIVAVSGHPGLSGRDLRELAWELEERHVDLVISPGIFEVAGPRLSIRAEAGVSLLHVERPVRTGSALLVKRIQDLVLAAVLSVLALPFLLVIALAVRLDSKGPVLYRQTRIGQRGQEFEIFKFRTMAVDAEARRSALIAQGHDVNAVLFKSRHDPRITRVGRYLRRFSVDEVPQLINVLRGEMSLVGPRPGLACEVDQYEPDAMRRLRVRPGMTGLWQVSGRSTLDWEQTVRLDLWYVDNWSSTLDFQILIRTARAVVGGSGAY